MKGLRRNKIRFFYALYETIGEITDEYGNATGEYEVGHGKPHECYGNISAAKGEMQTRQFGENESYDRVIVLVGDVPGIDEYSVLWIDVVPTFDEDGNTSTPYDYIVKKVARSLNVTSIAVSKVKVA